MRKIKIAQIGTSLNSHGNEIWNTICQQEDLFEIVGYALPENERKKFPTRMSDFEGCREMTVDEILNDTEIEAVAVETEEMYLTKYALMAAKAGKHLHMEKPGGCEFTEFEKLVDILKTKKLTFSLGYMYRFNPVIRQTLERVKNGEFGKIFLVEAYMDCKHDIKVREWLGNFPGGMMFFLGCHLIDLIYCIQGEPEEVIPLNCSTGIDNIHTDDFGMVLFKYKNGVSFAKTCDNEFGGFLRRQLVISGEKGTIEIKPLEYYAPDGMYTDYCEIKEIYDWNKPWEKGKSISYQRYDAMMRNFAEMVRGKENPYSYNYELNLYKLILKSCGKEM